MTAEWILTVVSLGDWPMLTRRVNAAQGEHMPTVEIPATEAARLWLIRYAWAVANTG